MTTAFPSSALAIRMSSFLSQPFRARCRSSLVTFDFGGFARRVMLAIVARAGSAAGLSRWYRSACFLILFHKDFPKRYRLLFAIAFGFEI